MEHLTAKKDKPKYKKGDKVCMICAAGLDMKNSSLPWHSEQLRAKDKYIEELLQEIKTLKELKC